MQARVKQDFRWNTVIAFSGVEFIKAEWRNVPPGKERDAENHPFLEVKDVKPASQVLLEKMVEETVVPTISVNLHEEEAAADDDVEREAEPEIIKKTRRSYSKKE